MSGIRNSEVSVFQRVPIYGCLWKCVWDCKKVSALERCLLREVSLYTHIYPYIGQENYYQILIFCIIV